MNSTAFKHLPNLANKIVSPDDSQFRPTVETLEQWDQMANQFGLGADWRLSNSELDQSLTEFLAKRAAAEPLWVFGFGSLIWDPGFYFDEVRLASISGYRRLFSIKTEIGRGSAEHPALMLSLEPGEASCTGLVFRIAPDDEEHELPIVWRREMIQGHYRPIWSTAQTPQGEVPVIVFGPNEQHPDHLGELPMEQVVRLISTGTGVFGTNAEYLDNLVDRLDEFNMSEDYLSELRSKVNLES